VRHKGAACSHAITLRRLLILVVIDPHIATEVISMQNKETEVISMQNL
jgi:phage FluMu protein gp41